MWTIIQRPRKNFAHKHLSEHLERMLNVYKNIYNISEFKFDKHNTCAL